MPQNSSGKMVGTSKLRYLFNEERGLEVVEVVPSQASEEIAAINKNRDEIGSRNNKRKNQHFSILISSLSRSFCRHHDDQEERSA